MKLGSEGIPELSTRRGVRPDQPEGGGSKQSGPESFCICDPSNGAIMKVDWRVPVSTLAG